MITTIVATILPSWLSSSLSSFGTFLVGAIGKALWDKVLAKIQLRNTRIERLEKLKAVIDEVKQLNDVQERFISKLNGMISTRINQPVTEENKDSFIVDNYDSMTPKETDIFLTIRGISSNSLKRNREELMKWVETDVEFKTNSIKSIKNDVGFELSMALIKLELNINIWQDKYTIWMENPKHPYVIVDDGSDFSETLNSVLSVIDRSIEKLRTDKRFLAKNPQS